MHAPTSRSNVFHFHVVLAKIVSNKRLAPLLGLNEVQSSSMKFPLENPGSASDAQPQYIL